MAHGEVLVAHGEVLVALGEGTLSTHVIALDRGTMARHGTRPRQ